MMKRSSLKLTAVVCLLLSVILILYKQGIREEHVEGTWKFQNADVPREFPRIFLFMDNITLYEDNTFVQVRDGEVFVRGNYYRTKKYIRFSSIKINGIPNRNVYRFRYFLKDEVLILEKNGEILTCFRDGA